MDTLLQRILNILIAPPGNLIFHLVLAFSVLASLQAVIITRRSGNFPNSSRLLFGLVMLLAGQLVLFLSSGLAWQGMLDPHVLLPPLDRAIFVFSQVWIVWLWCFWKPARLADLVTGFLNLIILILFLFTYTSWSTQAAGASFNNSWLDWIWELTAVIIVLTGMGILLFTRPSGWGYGVGMLGLSLSGVVAHALLTPNSGDFSGIVRLSQMAAYPLLPNLLHRMPASEKEQPAAAASKPQTAATISTSTHPPSIPGERRRYSSDPRTVHAFLQIIEKDDPEHIWFSIARAVGHTMFADLTFIITLSDFGQVVLHSGYDLIREDEMPGIALDQNKLLVLSGALQKGKGLRIISSDSQPSELAAINSALGLKESGTLMLIPLLIDDKPWGGLLLLSPYSNRQWSPEDQTYLASESQQIAVILRDARNAMEQNQDRLTTLPPTLVEPEGLKNLQDENDQLRTANYNLANALEEARNDLEQESQKHRQAAPASAELVALVALQKESQEVIAALQSENEQLRAAIRSHPTLPVESGRMETGRMESDLVQFDRLESDLRTTLKEMAHLQNQLADANAKILMLERQSSSGPETAFNTQENQDLLISIVQDLRQPMASILGYTDLLLSESVGILGGLQQKFLQRVRASTERMHVMMDDLIQLVSTGKSPVDLTPQPVEIGTIIDSAMIDTSAQLREKNITLRVDLPREMPLIHADQDAVQQIIVHLLQNAGAVTPQEGEITMRARVRNEANESYLLLQVVDQGGGIQPENLSRVFSPRYRADRPLIEGLGDTGVGLSIAKALVEAHNGRIWVESETGQTTTFSVLLPLRNHLVEEAAVE